MRFLIWKIYKKMKQIQAKKGRICEKYNLKDRVNVDRTYIKRTRKLRVETAYIKVKVIYSSEKEHKDQYGSASCHEEKRGPTYHDLGPQAKSWGDTYVKRNQTQQ